MRVHPLYLSCSVFSSLCGYQTQCIALTRNFGVEYATQNIRINAVELGYIDTPLLCVLDEEAHKMLVIKHPIGRVGKAEELANLVLFLSLIALDLSMVFIRLFNSDHYI